jgi:23S rRNA (adenine2503-C2)-methyltransferase
MTEASARRGLSGYSPGELAAILSPLPAFRARQIFKWISRGIETFHGMSDLPVNLRGDLEARFKIRSCDLSLKLSDPDGTTKLQLTLEDGAKIETVLLKDGADRKTACLSSQAGCAMGCIFCKTGALGFRRNLGAGEIVDQFLYLNSLSPGISNIVIMGMGEPLLNLEEVRRACGILCHPEGPGLSPRRITLSTSGIPEGILEMAEKGPPLRLALSLTAADEELRRELMPASRAYPLPSLKDALIRFQDADGGRVTLEAVLMRDINTRPSDAASLADFARGLDTVVNIIPWNPVPGLSFRGRPLQEPKAGEVENFVRLLQKAGIKTTRRYRKGRGVQGACGQLGE